MRDAAPQASADDDRVLRMTRIFAAPRDAVFRAWTDPNEFSQWWGPAGCTARCEVEPRVGGAWRGAIVNADGEEHIVSGVYLEFRPPERLVFTWKWDFEGDSAHQTVVTVDFFDKDGATEISMTQERFDTAEACEKHAGGWSSSFDCLRQYLTECEERE